MSDTLQQAITAIMLGDHAAGRQLLTQVLKNDPRNEDAWLWMSQVVSSPDEQIKCLQNVLKINPKNETARHKLGSLPRNRPHQTTPSPNRPTQTERKPLNFCRGRRNRCGARDPVVRSRHVDDPPAPVQFSWITHPSRIGTT